MSVKRSFRLTKGGWAFLALCAAMSVGAYNASLNMTYLLASLLIAVFAMSVVAPLWSVHGLECRRSLPEAPFAQEPFGVNFHVRSRRRGTARLITVSDPLCMNNGARQKGNLILRVPPRDQVVLRCQAVPHKRGVHSLPGLVWSSRFPFGVAESRAQRAEKEEIVVYPARGQLSQVTALSLRPTGSRTGSPSRTGLPGEEFRAVREYKPGDNPRWIHWRVSARQGKFYVREMDRERSAPVMVVLDSRLPRRESAAERARDENALELAVSFAAEICRVAEREGNLVTLVGFFPEPRCVHVERVTTPCVPAGIPTAPGAYATAAPSHMAAVYDALARLTPCHAPDADTLAPVAEEAGIGTAWQVIAVTPTRETAAGMANLLRGIPAQVHVTSEPGFLNTFRLAAAREVHA